MTVTMSQAEQAADLLGVDVFDLAWALRDAAKSTFDREIDKVRDFESPNFGKGRALLRAAQACDSAWSEVMSARRDEGEPSE